jgi:proteasome lid subunit RPN8/RPN11
MNLPNLSRPSPESPPVLTFAPLAWLKLQHFCHAGQTEIGGFGVSAANDLLYIEDFVTVRQQVSPFTVQFDDAAVADWIDRCIDRGLTMSRCARIWLHTHPGSSVTPSDTDEETFARVFGRCDWSVMFILGRTGQTYARLALAAGPGGALLVPVQVDWSAWPRVLADAAATLPALLDQWQQEYQAHIHMDRWQPGLPWDGAELRTAAPGTDPQGTDLVELTDFDHEVAWLEYEQFLRNEDWEHSLHGKDRQQ